MKNKNVFLVFFSIVFVVSFCSIQKIEFFNILIRKSIVSAKNFRNIRYKCSIPSVKKIPKKSILIIGHAYGSHKNAIIRETRNEGFIAPKINLLLEENKDKIDKVIFTGDIFYYFEEEKLQKLKNLYSSFFKIIIAPGNHEVYNNDSGYFTKKKKISSLNLQLFPYNIKDKNFNYIIDNSNEKRENKSLKLFKLINSNEDKRTIMFTHHVPISNMAYLSNEGNKVRKLPTYREYEAKINIPNLVVISGDGGAFNHLPRLSCYKFDNVKYIVNGIGELSDDKILLISKGVLYKYEI